MLEMQYKRQHQFKINKHVKLYGVIYQKMLLRVFNCMEADSLKDTSLSYSFPNGIHDSQVTK